jgi:hypothetical protein
MRRTVLGRIFRGLLAQFLMVAVHLGGFHPFVGCGGAISTLCPSYPRSGNSGLKLRDPGLLITATLHFERRHGYIALDTGSPSARSCISRCYCPFPGQALTAIRELLVMDGRHDTMITIFTRFIVTKGACAVELHCIAPPCCPVYTWHNYLSIRLASHHSFLGFLETHLI